MASGAPRRLTRAESAPLLRSFDHPLLHVRRRRRGLRRAHRPGDPRPALLRARSRNIHAPRPARGGDAANRATRTQGRRRRRSVNWRKAARSRRGVVEGACRSSADGCDRFLARTRGRSCSAGRCALSADRAAGRAQTVVRAAGRGPAACPRRPSSPPLEWGHRRSATRPGLSLSRNRQATPKIPSPSPGSTRPWRVMGSVQRPLPSPGQRRLL